MALAHVRDMRQAADIKRPFQFRVIDTKNMFAGSGLPAMALRDMLRQQMQPKEIHDALFKVIDSTYTYYVPDDLDYARTRSRVRGDRSINLVSVVHGRHAGDQADHPRLPRRHPSGEQVSRSCRI